MGGDLRVGELAEEREADHLGLSFGQPAQRRPQRRGLTAVDGVLGHRARACVPFLGLVGAAPVAGGVAPH